MECPHLHGKDSCYILDNLITEENFRECPDWVMVQPRQKNVRDLSYSIAGSQAMGILHSLPTGMMDALRQGEKDERMYDEIPDFYRMIRKGMGSTEREEQLKYQANEDGQVVVEIDHEGNEFKLARPIYQLKAYATNPDGPVKAPKTAIFWHDDQTIAEIIKAEVGLGLVIKDKKTTGKSETPNQETTMEQGKKVKVTTNRPAVQLPGAVMQGKVGPQPKMAPNPVGRPPQAKMTPPKPPSAQMLGANTGGKISHPPSRTGPGVVGKAQTRVSEQSQPAEIDMTAIKAVIQQAVASALEPALAAIADSKETLLSAITIFADLSAQTAGTYQYPDVDENGNMLVNEEGTAVMRPLPQVSAKPSKMLAFIDGSAYEAEEEAQPEGE